MARHLVLGGPQVRRAFDEAHSAQRRHRLVELGLLPDARRSAGRHLLVERGAVQEVHGNRVLEAQAPSPLDELHDVDHAWVPGRCRGRARRCQCTRRRQPAFVGSHDGSEHSADEENGDAHGGDDLASPELRAHRGRGRMGGHPSRVAWIGSLRRSGGTRRSQKIEVMLFQVRSSQPEEDVGFGAGRGGAGGGWRVGRMA